MTDLKTDKVTTMLISLDTLLKNSKHTRAYICISISSLMPCCGIVWWVPSPVFPVRRLPFMFLLSWTQLSWWPNCRISLMETWELIGCPLLMETSVNNQIWFHLNPTNVPISTDNCILYNFFWLCVDRVLRSKRWPWTIYVAVENLDLLIILPLLP